MRFNDICEKLKLAGIVDPVTEAALLLEKFCGVKRSSIRLREEENFDCDELARAVEKRAMRYPLQYILGEWYFYREKYIVNESCLIPRSDTEILVEKAICELPENASFADLCTGSGCIAVSILANRGDCVASAFEISRDALALARQNAELNGVSGRFHSFEADVLKPILVGAENEEPIFDAILSNPPYIKTELISCLDEEVKKEPSIALDGGDDGLVFYRAILKNHSHLLKEKGFIAFEIGYDQGDELRSLSALHGFSCEIIKDYGGNDRVAFLRRSIKY